MENLEKKSQQLFYKLKKVGKTLAFAESITAGNLCAGMVRYPGVSEILLGGIVAYDNSVKQDLLAVTATTLADEGAVSEETVRQMVAGLKSRIPADFCAAVSGIAGPGGGSDEKPVGTVWLGIASGGTISSMVKVFDGNREKVIRDCVDWVYSELLKIV